MYNYGRYKPEMRYGRGSAEYDHIPSHSYPTQPRTDRFFDPNEQSIEGSKRTRDYGRDNIYFNIEISNPLTSNPAYNIPPFQNSQNTIIAEYMENTTQPILSNPSEYYLTIARFSVPGLSIPIIDMDIIPNQPNQNLTPYVLTLSFGGIDFPVNILYFSADLTTSLPGPPIPIKQQSDYYYVYEYNIMIQMMNIALRTSFNALKAAFPAAPPTEPPFFEFNEETQLISLVAQNSYSEVIAGGPTIEVWANDIFYFRFVNSMMINYIGSNQVNGKDVRFLFPPTTLQTFVSVTNPLGTQLLEPKYNDLYAINASNPVGAFARLPRDYTLSINNPALAGLNGAYLFNTQEFVTLQYWNSFKNIIFTTASIPIQAEYIPANNTTGGQGSGSVAYKPILTDFEPLLPRAGDARTLLQYYPQGPYRLIDLLGTQPLQKLDIKIFWQDIYDNLHPLVIGPNELASVKLLFIKKLQ